MTNTLILISLLYAIGTVVSGISFICYVAYQEGRKNNNEPVYSIDEKMEVFALSLIWPFVITAFVVAVVAERLHPIMEKVFKRIINKAYQYGKQKNKSIPNGNNEP